MISKPSNPGVEFGGEDRNQTKIAAFSKLSNRPLPLHSTLRVQYQSSIDQLPIYYRFTGTFTGCRFDCEARVDSQHSPFVRSSPALPERRRREQSRSFKYVEIHILEGMLSTQKCEVGHAGADFTGAANSTTQHF
jgi:hypothetical protein